MNLSFLLKKLSKYRYEWLQKKKKEKKSCDETVTFKRKQLLTPAYHMHYDENDSLIYIYLWTLCNYMLTYGFCHSCYGNTLTVI